MKTVISLCGELACGRAMRAADLCSMHYQRLKRTGTTSPRATPTVHERFWSKVDKSGDCWLWTAAKYSNGYGHFGIDAERGAIAHRYAWEQIVGPIPSDLVLDHTCHERACVNPAHLRHATIKQNIENQGALRSDNSSGVRGVHRHANGRHWVARVTHNQAEYHAGLFLELSDAEAAVIAKRNELFTHNDLDRKVS